MMFAESFLESRNTWANDNEWKKIGNDDVESELIIIYLASKITI